MDSMREAHGRVVQQAMARYGQWDGLDQSSGVITAARDKQLAGVTTMLTGTGLTLKAIPAPRYWKPAEPSVLRRLPRPQPSPRHRSSAAV